MCVDTLSFRIGDKIGVSADYVPEEALGVCRVLRA